MSIYNSSREMLQDAANKGLIKISGVTVRVGSAKVFLPNTINVINNEGWTDFLRSIIEHSDNDEEKYFVQQFLDVYEQVISSIEAHERQQKFRTVTKKSMPKELVHIDQSQKVVTKDDVTNLSIDLAKCDTIDDIFNYMGINFSSNIPDKIFWKRPVTINGILRYAAHNINWYIDRQVHGRDFFYSIFNPEKREVARYDKIKDAKDDILNVIKKLS